MIRFETIVLKNFGSFVGKPYRFNLGKPGLNIIKGENGAGKTTLINGIVWAIYGKGVKPQASVETWEWLRPREYTGTYVELSFLASMNHYKVIRCLNYTEKVLGSKGANRLIILENEKELPIKGKNDLQKWLISKIGMSYDLFLSSIIFGQKLKRLIEESGTKQKEILDEAFETYFILKAKEKAQSKTTALRTELFKVNAEASSHESNIEHLTRELDNLKSLKENFESDKKSRIKTAQGKLQEKRVELKRLSSKPNYHESDKLRRKIKVVKDQINQLENVDTEKYTRIISITQTNITHLAGEIGSLNSSLISFSGNCPVCNTPFDPSKVKEHKKEIKDQIDEKTIALNKLKSLIVGYKKKFASAKKKLTSIKSLENKLKILERELNESLIIKNDIKNLEKAIKEQELLIKSFEAEKPNFKMGRVKRELEKLIDDLIPLKKQATHLERDLRNHEWAINDPLSNTGLKVYIFNTMLKSINKHLLFYSRKMGLRSEFQINLESYRKGLENYIYIGDNKVPYEDLSGGQGQLINIAIAFSIHDEVTKNNPINTLFLDEVFESLSKKNIEIISDIIYEKSKNKSIWLITHREEFSTVNANILEFSLQSGLTTIN